MKKILEKGKVGEICQPEKVGTVLTLNSLLFNFLDRELGLAETITIWIGD